MADEIVTADICDEREIRLDGDGRDTIMRALLTGLAAFGELEKLRNACEIRRICDEEVPDDLNPIDVSVGADEIANFATAMMILH